MRCDGVRAAPQHPLRDAPGGRYRVGTDALGGPADQAGNNPLAGPSLEPMTGIEPAYSAWETDVLPRHTSASAGGSVPRGPAGVAMVCHPLRGHSLTRSAELSRSERTSVRVRIRRRRTGEPHLRGWRTPRASRVSTAGTRSVGRATTMVCRPSKGLIGAGGVLVNPWPVRATRPRRADRYDAGMVAVDYRRLERDQAGSWPSMDLAAWHRQPSFADGPRQRSPGPLVLAPSIRTSDQFHPGIAWKGRITGYGDQLLQPGELAFKFLAPRAAPGFAPRLPIATVPLARGAPTHPHRRSAAAAPRGPAALF
jgi:hypothetical protein